MALPPSSSPGSPSSYMDSFSHRCRAICSIRRAKAWHTANHHLSSDLLASGGTMIPIGSPALEVDTPALVVDRDRLEANIRRFADMVAQGGTALRPHIKTHKTVEIAALQVQAGARGITCAKL